MLRSILGPGPGQALPPCPAPDRPRQPGHIQSLFPDRLRLVFLLPDPEAAPPGACPACVHQVALEGRPEPGVAPAFGVARTG